MRKKRLLKVKVIFELDRLSEKNLAKAYEQIVPNYIRIIEPEVMATETVQKVTQQKEEKRG